MTTETIRVIKFTFVYVLNIVILAIVFYFNYANPFNDKYIGYEITKAYGIGDVGTFFMCVSLVILIYIFFITTYSIIIQNISTKLSNTTMNIVCGISLIISLGIFYVDTFSFEQNFYRCYDTTGTIVTNSSGTKTYQPLQNTKYKNNQELWIKRGFNCPNYGKFMELGNNTPYKFTAAELQKI
jgi:cation transport ATPase